MTDTALALADREGYERIIVITDEQSHQVVRAPKGKGYFINVGTYKNGIGYGAWTHIDGGSEAVIDYVREAESTDLVVYNCGGQWIPRVAHPLRCPRCFKALDYATA